jgi:ATP-dependent 26S proteasome regulatory subunit
MHSLPTSNENRKVALPPSVTLEPAAIALASLSVTDNMRLLAETVVEQWKRVTLFERLKKHGIYPVRNVLMYGPPGNGKTLACQWLAKEIGAPLYRVRCEQLVQSNLGKTAQEMRQLMDCLRTVGKAVILFDEVEQIFPSRESDGSNEACRREIASAMTVFWQELDRWTSPQLFCFATNMRSRLDPALLSRFELELEFEKPNQDQIRAVCAYWSEVFHDCNPQAWGPVVSEHQFTSFRELWQTIAHHVRAEALKCDA